MTLSNGLTHEKVDGGYRYYNIHTDSIEFISDADYKAGLEKVLEYHQKKVADIAAKLSCLG